MKKIFFCLIALIFTTITSFAKNNNSKDIVFYLVNSSTVVGSMTDTGFISSKEIIGKSLLNGKINVEIEKFEILDTDDDTLKYIVIHGSALEKDPDGKDSKAFYKIAFPISTQKALASSDTTHTCKSYDSIIFGCSCCTFLKNKSGSITGCKCCEFGWCTHEVTNTNTLTKSFNSLLL
jgi:hypothetical protein